MASDAEVEVEVNSGKSRWIELSHTVCGKEHDPGKDLAFALSIFSWPSSISIADIRRI